MIMEQDHTDEGGVKIFRSLCFYQASTQYMSTSKGSFPQVVGYCPMMQMLTFKCFPHLTHFVSCFVDYTFWAICLVSFACSQGTSFGCCNLDFLSVWMYGELT